MFEPDTEVLQDVCREIALENSGLLYVTEQKEEIRSRYENRAGDEGLAGTVKGVLGGESIDLDQLRTELADLESSDHTEFERLRSGVYFYDPTSAPKTGPSDPDIRDDIRSLFRSSIVVPDRKLETKFGVAKKDVDGFARRLERADFLERISTSDQGMYFTAGSDLRDESSGATVEANLQRRADDGLIAHSDLEAAIDVSATKDIISYLESQGYIKELDDKYLVVSAIDAFARSVVGEFLDRVVEEFEEVNGVMSVTEFESLAENEFKTHSSELSNLDARDEHRREILDIAREETREMAGIEIDESNDVAVLTDAFEAAVEKRATVIIDEVERDFDGVVPTKSVYLEEAAPHVEELTIGTDAADAYYRAQVTEAVEEIARRRIEGEATDQ